MTTTFSAERWLSGRKHRFAKPTYGDNSYRGFKSRSLRHFPKPFQCSKLKILHCLLTCALQLKVQLVWICSDAFDGVYQWQAVKIACMNGKIILGNGLTSLPLITFETRQRWRNGADLPAIWLSYRTFKSTFITFLTRKLTSLLPGFGNATNDQQTLVSGSKDGGIIFSNHESFHRDDCLEPDPLQPPFPWNQGRVKRRVLPDDLRHAFQNPPDRWVN